MTRDKKTGTTRDGLLLLIRNGSPMTLRQQLRLTAVLSLPAIMAQMSTIIMEYIDASMVGSLGTEASASIGLMATSTWLLWGLCTATATGFSVQVAHRIGASDKDGAIGVFCQSLTVALMVSALLAVTGVAISNPLPRWLGGDATICKDATTYFMIFACFLPSYMISFLSGSILRCSGNTLVPGIVNVLMCVLDVALNMLLIFPTREVSAFGMQFTVAGAGLGVMGAAIGTGLAEVIGGSIMLWYLWNRNSELNLKGHHINFMPQKQCLRRAWRIGAPIGAEHALRSGAQILSTVIVAPLGAVSIAANAFAVTAESLCYMPGYGVSEAATTLVGQSLGASRKKLARKFAYITVATGIAIMSIMGVVMYYASPLMMGIISPVEEIRTLGVSILRIEAWAEPMFAAAIVAYGVFIGAGDTLMPCCMNLGSIWGVRLTLAAFLAPTMGLRGVWLAMAIELCFRGFIFLWRLKTDYWIKSSKKLSTL